MCLPTSDSCSPNNSRLVISPPRFALNWLEGAAGDVPALHVADYFLNSLLALYLPEHEEFEQRLLGVEAILGFIPHHALRAVDHLGGHFLAAVRGQAVHEERLLRRRFHHLGVDLPVLEGAPSLLVLRLEPH